MLKKFKNRAKRFRSTTHERFFENIRVEFLVHELKDPVAVIETTLRALVDHKDTYGALNLRQETTLKRALLSSKKIRQMLNDLLEIGRGQAASFIHRKFVAADVAFDALISALEVQAYLIFEEIGQFKQPAEKLIHLASQHGIHFILAQNIKNLEMVLDETKFRLILANLIKNALYHHNEKVVLRLSLKKSQLIVAVEDDGPGVAPEHHELIFQQYMQIDQMSQIPRSGHGLGLAGARILARCLGGDITIQSRKREGAIFYVTLPISARVQ